MNVLDTDFLIALLRKNEQAEAKLRLLEQNAGELGTTIFNLEELYIGAYASNRTQDNMAEIARIIASCTVPPYDIRAMKESAKITTTLKKKGSSIGQTDERIAAIALANNATLVTRNTRHFTRIPRLSLEQW